MPPVLRGVRVLDFGQYIAGPFAAMLLGEQGAEVTKVERPGGDPMRYHPGFSVWNRSKKGIRLDLKREAGLRVAHELAEQSDVIIESLSPGVADRLGIGYGAISEINPRSVYCSVSGFGQEGPYRDMPGWDPIVASVAGVYTTQAGQGVPPIYVVMPMPSYYAALMASFSIATALFTREITGQGQKVDVSLFGAMLGASSAGLVDFEGKVVRVAAARDQQGGSPVYRLYQGSDGHWFFLGLGNLSFLAKFAVAMGHEEWLMDGRFDGAPFLIMPPRSTELAAMLQEIFLTKTRDEWLEFLRAADIPCAGAGTVEEYLDDPQVIANGMVIEMDQPGVGKVRQMGVPVRLDRTPGGVAGPAPALGEHSAEVLGRLGYTARDIADLAGQGAI
jgi:crotonobetainyl-CoA:carnitine CoA-transferase CaiB-like acyl-CoA transferase